MQQSKQTVPHFYVTRVIDMTAAMKYRQGLNEREDSTKDASVSINDLIVRACALAIREFAGINATYTDDGHMVFWEDINIGIAVAFDDELIAPVLEHADGFSLQQLSQETARLIASARQGKLTGLVPTRFTVSNLGMYSIDNFIAIINPPETAILAVASIQKSVVVRADSTLAIRDLMNATLSMDHRVGNGVLACQFINRLKALLENPEQLA
jgi:pyruvate dehydrogenase E2 component (dihydrolipoamide acetyltransferase)